MNTLTKVTYNIHIIAPKCALRFDSTDVCALLWVLTLRQTIIYPLNAIVFDVPGKPTMCTQLLNLQKHVDPPRNAWLKAIKYSIEVLADCLA